MSATDDVWKSPESDAQPPVEAPEGRLEGGSDDPMDVPRAVWADLTAHPVPYLLANLGYMGAIMAFLVVVLAVFALAAAPGIVTEDETVLFVGVMAGFAVYTLSLLALAFVAVPLFTASTLRAIDRQRQGLGTVGVASTFNDMGTRAGAVIGTYALTQALAFVGILFFYVPGLLAMAIGSFALPIAVFEDVGAIEAWKRAWGHAKNHAAWHIGVFAMLFVAILVLEMSIVGLFFLWPVLCAWQLYAYRLAYGPEGSSPVD
jgi:uncharacterized membrane protein